MLEHLPFVCLQEMLNSPSSQHQGSSPGLLCLLPSLEREADSQESQSHVGKTTQTGDIALPAQPQLPPVPKPPARAAVPAQLPRTGVSSPGPGRAARRVHYLQNYRAMICLKYPPAPPLPLPPLPEQIPVLPAPIPGAAAGANLCLARC